MAKLNEAGHMVLESAGKMNCWEHKKCGRQPGGSKSAELGICPVTIYAELDGAHGGKNAGRACWAIAGSLCGGKVQGTYAQKLHNCWRCDFMNRVKQEEEPNPHGFSATRLGMDKVIEKQNAKSAVAPAAGQEQKRH
ncbi:MAG TPA: hypothetical protein VL197_16770 [Nitrospirota bacterium]|nr:hypothetical protein [Nitrospirota bacterium]